MLIFSMCMCVCVYERQKMDIVDLTEFKHTYTHTHTHTHTQEDPPNPLFFNLFLNTCFIILQSRSLYSTIWSHCGWKMEPPQPWSLSFLWWVVSLYQFQSLGGVGNSFTFWAFSLAHGQLQPEAIKRKNYRNKQFLSFKLWAILSDEILCCLAPGHELSSIWCIHHKLVSSLFAYWSNSLNLSACVQVTIISLNTELRMSEWNWW